MYEKFLTFHLVVHYLNDILLYTVKLGVKPGQNKKVQKIFQLHRFLNTFLQLAAEKKYSKNGAAGNFFGPSYFVTALVDWSTIQFGRFFPKVTYISIKFPLHKL